MSSKSASAGDSASIISSTTVTSYDPSSNQSTASLIPHPTPSTKPNVKDQKSPDTASANDKKKKEKSQKKKGKETEKLPYPLVPTMTFC